MTTPRLRPLGAAALALIAALALTWASATAQEPTAATTGTTLHPGANLIGWVGETAPVSQLFRDIPQLEAVWAWDAELDDWIVAGRNVPEGLGWLWQVTPGMGLYMVLNGDQPFRWQRSTEPTRGLVELRTGWNLVAWSGANETPINDATKGIGWSLREVRRHNAETQQWNTWTSPERTAQLIATDQSEETETPTIQRGEALWINVARAVRWLQPTDILPRLIFPGGASDELQSRVREDLESVLAFYRTQYGIQADPDFTVYVAKDVDSLIQAQRDDGEEIDDAEAASIRALWDRAIGWGGEDIWVKQSKWPEDLPIDEIARGRYLLTHEYFHVLQSQLSDSWASQWLVEGTADWAEGEHQVWDGERTLQDLREREQSELSSYTPTLRSTESENDTWEYTLGWLATDQLTADAGSDSSLEFWRRLGSFETEIETYVEASSEIDPDGFWVPLQVQAWQTAFNETFGFPAVEFYADFDARQRGRAATNRAPANTNDGDTLWIHGRVTTGSDDPVAGIIVNAIRKEGKISVGWRQRAETNSTGTFRIKAPENGDYLLWINVNDDCMGYYKDGKLIAVEGWFDPARSNVRSVEIAGSDLRGVDIRLPSNFCGWQIRGRAFDTTGDPLIGVYVTACLPPGSDGVCSRDAQTALDGSFAVSLFAAGEYKLTLSINSCELYHRSTGATFQWDAGTPISVTDGDVADVQVYVPSGLCSQQVSGNIDGVERFFDNNARVVVSLCQVNACGNGVTYDRAVGRDGSFDDITVPVAGAYRLNLVADGCEMYYQTNGLTTNWRDSSGLYVAEADDLTVRLRVPERMCAYRITGSITMSDGQPHPNYWLSICREPDGSCYPNQKNGHGTFTFSVPDEGEYSFSVNIRSGCAYDFVGQLGGSDNPVRVSGGDVSSIDLRVPYARGEVWIPTIEELCD